MIPVGLPGELFAGLALTAIGIMLVGMLARDRAAQEARRVATWRRQHRARAAR